MKKQLWILYFASLLSPTTAFSNNGGISENPRLKNFQLLYQSAEAAMQSGDYLKASEAYHAILKQKVEGLVDSWTYADLILRLVQAEEKLNRIDEASTLLTDLVKLKLPPDRKKAALGKLARLKSELGQPGDGYLLFLQLEESIPRCEWAPEDRVFAEALEFTLNTQHEKMLARAEKYLDAGLYCESATLYNEVLNDIKSRHYPRALQQIEIAEGVLYRTADAYYRNQDFQEVVNLLAHFRNYILKNGESSPPSQIQHQALYLLGLAEKNLGHFEQAIASLLTYLNLHDETIPHENEARWQLGLCYFQLHHFEEARREAARVVHSPNQEISGAAKLLLAKIDLSEVQYEKAENALFALSSALPETDPRQFEISYLRGEAAFQCENYLEAAKLFEKAILKRNQEQSDWYPQALYNLGWSYLKLTDGLTDASPSYQALLGGAEKAFKKLISYNRDPHAYLGLARVFFLENSILKDDTAPLRLETLLGQAEQFSSADNQAEALYLRAQVAPSGPLKKELLEKLTSDAYKETYFYCEGWYERSMQESATGNFSLAIPSLNRTIDLLKEVDQPRMLQVKKELTRAYFNQNSLEGRKVAFGLCNELLEEPSLEEVDEILYLKGLIASLLSQEENSAHYSDIAEQALRGVIANYPQGRFASAALITLGTNYFQARKFEEAEALFIQLGKNYPLSIEAGDAWFWAAECSEQLRRPSHLVQEYRQRVFDGYPRAQKAAEAYFNYYTFTDYLSGNKQAIQHLQAMAVRFPLSPFLIVAHYLRGLDLKQSHPNSNELASAAPDFHEAVRAFEDAIASFDNCRKLNSLPVDQMDYFATVRYRAYLELVLTELALSDQIEGTAKIDFQDKAISTLLIVLSEFENASHPIASLVLKKNGTAKIFDEVEFTLVQAYLKQRNELRAETHLKNIMDRFSQAHISQGYYLSRAHYELACLLMKKGEYQNALQELVLSENSAKEKFLTTDQRAEIWIKQSLCYRSLNQLNEAMLTLAKAASEEHPSALCCEAMFLRAEIYELQGRPHLAMKQLESLRSKGGHWGLKASEKLIREYGAD